MSEQIPLFIIIEMLYIKKQKTKFKDPDGLNKCETISSSYYFLISYKYS